MIRNVITDNRGFRYEAIVRQFATSLYILGNRTAYEFVRLNIPAFLPSVQIIQSYIAASNSRLTEGQFNYNDALNYFRSNQSTLDFIAEDATAVVPKVTYDTTSNSFIGFSLPLNSNGLPITDFYSTNSFTRLEEWYASVPIAKSLNACLVQPLSSSLNSSSPYLLAAYGTDNKFTSSDVICRWHHIHQQFKAKDIRILGFSTDCDSRYLHAMRVSLGFFTTFAYIAHPDLFTIDLPRTWSWYFMQQEQLYICFQDPPHICTRLRNRLLSDTTNLLLGDQLINIEPLLYIMDNYSKLDHLLVLSDVDPKDRQNYNSAVKISSDNVINLLERIPNTLGLKIYLQWLWINANDKQELDLNLSQISDFDTTFNNNQCQTKRQYFITYQSLFCVEINAHFLIYLSMLVSEGKLPIEALNIWLQNSQSCEGTFRSARAISSVSSAGVNFTVSQFINRSNKLSVLQNIKINSNQNKIRFPHHHKLSKTLEHSSNSSNKTFLSKRAIERRVHDAYKYVTELFSPLNLKEILRNGKVISLEEMSIITSQQYETFWSKGINDINIMDANLDVELENQNNYYIDSDEEFELNENLEMTDDVSMSTNHGMRLTNIVKEELSHTYFKVNINNGHKYLHKQAACWFLEKDKCSLSADRLSRVQGR